MSGKSDVAYPKNSIFEREKNKSIKELKSQAREVLNFLNEKTGRGYRPVDANLNFIMVRLNSGVTVGQCFQVIAKELSLKSKHRLERILKSYAIQMALKEVWYFCAPSVIPSLNNLIVKKPYIKIFSVKEFLS